MDAQTARRAIEAIERNARNQLRLVEDILDVSRIMTGGLRLDLETIDVATIVAAAAEVVRPAAEAKHIELRLALPQDCVSAADPVRLQQIIWNLASNAVKFTPEGGRVDLSVRRTAGRVTIEVTDTGAGIDATFLPHVFDRFRQFDGSKTRRHGASGSAFRS